MKSEQPSMFRENSKNDWRCPKVPFFNWKSGTAASYLLTVYCVFAGKPEHKCVLPFITSAQCYSLVAPEELYTNLKPEDYDSLYGASSSLFDGLKFNSVPRGPEYCRFVLYLTLDTPEDMNLWEYSDKEPLQIQDRTIQKKKLP